MLTFHAVIPCPKMKQHINHLIEETSPYLLQHAHHPVNWEAWRPSTFEKAKKENKLVAISIGYSSCHWCHVMAHESFEDEEIGALMNENFINIKVDREERPDVDQVYMNALQLMTGKGGWPLNIIALPDGRPIWGGTYLRKEQWEGILHQLNDLYRQAPEKMIDYAEKLTLGIREMESLVVKADQGNFDPEFFKKVLAHWETRFDTIHGGSHGAPKFMMPNNYHFLLRYASQTKNKPLLDFVITTLDKMSFGGIYDQLGGGFSRYSTDEKWHVPHFEKMLYDNAQLVSLYCDAFLVTKNPQYEKVVKSTLKFVKKKLTSETGSFYCALDADSMNEYDVLEEGAYYVWTKEELHKILENDFPLFSEYFTINETAHWEKGHYVLMRTEKTTVIAEKFSLSENTVEEKIALCIEKLMNRRSKRAAPGLDDKSLTSWNALMLKGYCDAYRVFHEKEYLEMALKNAAFLLEKQVQATGELFHSFKNGKSSVNGYLEDYAFTIEAFLSLYENTFDEKWLCSAEKLTEKAWENFYDPKNSMFYFVSKNETPLIARTVEYQDNVMPSSNSVMAKNLFKLSHYLGKIEYHKLSEQLLKNILPHIGNYPEAFSNWLDVLLNFTHDFYEVAILGEKAKKMVWELNKNYVPNKLLAGKTKQSDLPLLKNRWWPGESLLYVCENNRCKLPVKTVEEALKQMI